MRSRTKARDAAEAREIEARRLVDQPVGAPVGEAAAEIAPGRVLLLGIVGVDRVVVAVARMLEQARHLGRRVLQVVVHGDGIGAARPGEARHHRVVLAEIAAEAQHRDRRARLGGELLADVEAVVRAAVDHQHDLEAALDLERRAAPAPARRPWRRRCRPARRRRARAAGAQPSRAATTIREPPNGRLSPARSPPARRRGPPRTARRASADSRARRFRRRRARPVDGAASGETTGCSSSSIEDAEAVAGEQGARLAAGEAADIVHAPVMRRQQPAIGRQIEDARSRPARGSDAPLSGQAPARPRHGTAHRARGSRPARRRPSGISLTEPAADRPAGLGRGKDGRQASYSSPSVAMAGHRGPQFQQHAAGAAAGIEHGPVRPANAASARTRSLRGKRAQAAIPPHAVLDLVHALVFSPLHAVPAPAQVSSCRPLMISSSRLANRHDQTPDDSAARRTAAAGAAVRPADPVAGRLLLPAHQPRRRRHPRCLGALGRRREALCRGDRREPAAHLRRARAAGADRQDPAGRAPRSGSPPGWWPASSPRSGPAGGWCGWCRRPTMR